MRSRPSVLTILYGKGDHELDQLAVFVGVFVASDQPRRPDAYHCQGASQEIVSSSHRLRYRRSSTIRPLVCTRRVWQDENVCAES